MRELIKVEIEKTKKEIVSILSKATITDDRAFSYVLLSNFFNVIDIFDQDDCVTDGPNDGGIDFVIYDDEESRVIACQAKYTKSLTYEEIGNELDKMHSTINNFKIGNTGAYNDKLKKVLQNALDRLPDDNLDNIVFNVFTSAELNINEAVKKLENSVHSFPMDFVTIYAQNEIEDQIQSVKEQIDIVDYEKIKIDQAKNFLKYESDNAKGVMVNIQSTSLISMYNKYSSKGLFDLNIRRYIKHNLVDSGINRTLDKNREDFWFLNNGIIIACEEFELDGNTIVLHNFSIVNGGQTTTLIGKYKGSNKKEFSIPCKIIASVKPVKKGSGDNLEFFTKIAEATNSQKPILPRDLKSNSPEMIRLGKMLLDNRIFMEIKRGVKSHHNYDYSIKNDELAQLLLSMIYQKPGTSRSGKKAIFENADIYSKLFKANYDKDSNKKDFLIDLVIFHHRYLKIEAELKKDGLNELQSEVLKNGRQVIYALLGILYLLVNNDLKENDLIKDKNIVKNNEFVYGKFISNYSKDDIDKKIKRIVIDLVKIISESYKTAYDNKLATSVSNHFKTDSKYFDSIVTHFIDCLSMTVGEDLKAQIDILKRGKTY